MPRRVLLSVAAMIAVAVGSSVPAAALPAAPGPTQRAEARAASSPRTVARIAVLGDIACDPSSPYYAGGRGDRWHCRQRAVGRLVARLNPDAVVTTGDNQYEKGTLRTFRTSYEAALGRLRGRTWPVPGNHEYVTPGAAGYFGYFGRRAGSAQQPWRSFRPGAGWRVVLLDSNCWAVGGCGRRSAQGRWLRNRLATAPQPCTVAAWHHPLHSAGAYRGNPEVAKLARPLWRQAAAGGVDIVVNGHDHGYQRWAVRSQMREFVSGAGGKSLYQIGRARGLRFGDDSHFGVLLLTLRSDGTYRHAFVRLGGQRVDRGVGRCRNR